jgi:hypothetical protein
MSLVIQFVLRIRVRGTETTRANNITITILYVNLPPVSYLKLNVSETGFCLRVHMEPTEFGPVDRASIHLRTGEDWSGDRD